MSRASSQSMETEPAGERSEELSFRLEPGSVSVVAPGGVVVLSLRLAGAGVRLEIARPELTLSVPGQLVLEGEAVTVRARRGDLRMEANDDVRVVAERIFLN